MSTADIERLRSLRTFPQLVKYLRNELDWPIESDDFDDLTFDYEPEELGLSSEVAVKIKEVKQLRPLTANQPWGIFFVNFEPKRLPVVVLRRILRELVIKKRQSANKAQQKAWQLHDLLFISSYGESNHRQITFAQFSEAAEVGDLPVLRVLGWDDRDTGLHLDHTDKTLREKLRWPDPDDIDKLDEWRSAWASAFTLRHGEVIRTSKAMAEQLAVLATSIRKKVNLVLKVESEKGPLRKLHAAFTEALIHDLSADDFADMYAQTIAYGLLTARVSRPAGLVAENLRDMVPVTNPFLKDLLDTFLAAGGRKGKVDFDELGVSEVVQLLRDADMEAVLRDFGDRNPEEDPAIHFYELFLKEYDPEKRMKRGVFYTPRPVVSYIVRSVHELLKTEFGLEDGIASTVTWSEMVKKHKDLKIPKGTKPEQEFVQILDPACGTGTFLVEVIDVIHKTMIERWRMEGHTPFDIPKLWNEYVPDHVLSRLYGYELMMAPYAIAHMKIGLKLYETGYRFGSIERARIYLTNSLEPPQDFSDRFEFDAPALAHEAHAVNAIKRRQRFTIVIGNPPYSKMSGNLGTAAVALIEPFRYVDGERIVEKGALALELNLQDDYVKFWGLLCKEILATNAGVGSFISNSRYLGSPTLRGFRGHLCGHFSNAYFLDLGGQVSERKSIGTTDENVFDIEQGVAIGALVRLTATSGITTVRSSRLAGPRLDKYSALSRSSVLELPNHVSVTSPYYRFNRTEDDSDEEFDAWPALNEIMPFNSGCVITSRDNLAIDFDRIPLLEKVARFASSRRGDRTIEEEIGYSVKAKWDVERCKEEIRSLQRPEECVKPILYRPFDARFVFYLPSLLDTPSKPVCESVYEQDNLVLLSPGVKTSSEFTHALVSRFPAEKKACSHDRATQMFPLCAHKSGLLGSSAPNISLQMSEMMNARDVFNYVYAILYSPGYRTRYGAALRDSFPRIPTVVADMPMVHELARLGGEVAALHLLESPTLDKHISEYVGKRAPEIEKVSYSKNTVWVDRAKMNGFRGIPEAIWNFHIGGYQVCEKWLKDRKGRKLLKGDIEHYNRIVVALNETMRIMTEIDEVIDAHGGWPAAFTTKPVGKSQEVK